MRPPSACRRASVQVSQVLWNGQTWAVNDFVQVAAPEPAVCPWILLINKLYRLRSGVWMIQGPWLYHREHGMQQHIPAHHSHCELVMSDHINSNQLHTVLRKVTVVSKADWSSKQAGWQAGEVFFVRKFCSFSTMRVCQLDWDAYVLGLLGKCGQPRLSVALPRWSTSQFYGSMLCHRLHRSLTVHCGPLVTCELRLDLTQFCLLWQGSDLAFEYNTRGHFLQCKVWQVEQLSGLLGACDPLRKAGWPFRHYSTGTVVQVCTCPTPITLKYYLTSQLLRTHFPVQVVSDIGVVQVAQ
jgi:BAH domain-containing protein